MNPFTYRQWTTIVGTIGTYALASLIGCRSNVDNQAKPDITTRSEVVNGIGVRYEDIRKPEDLNVSRQEALRLIYEHGWTKDSTGVLTIGSHYTSTQRTTTVEEMRAETLRKFGKTGLHRLDSSLVVFGIVKSWSDLPGSSPQRPLSNPITEKP